MHIITWRAPAMFMRKHPDSENALRAWRHLVERASWRNFAELRSDYAGADQVGKFTVFNIGGNKYRLVAAVHFNRRKVFVRHILTHKDYDRGHWKDG